MAKVIKTPYAYWLTKHTFVYLPKIDSIYRILSYVSVKWSVIILFYFWQQVISYIIERKIYFVLLEPVND